jgi:hypothetical protein
VGEKVTAHDRDKSSPLLLGGDIFDRVYLEFSADPLKGVSDFWRFLSPFARVWGCVPGAKADEICSIGY